MRAELWQKPSKTNILKILTAFKMQKEVRKSRTEKCSHGISSQMIDNYMIHKLPIFASYHSNFWYFKMI